MERQKIIAGDKVEPIYGEQNETCTVISTDVRMRANNGQWLDAIVYASSRDGLGGAWKVMDKDSFYERYKVFGEVIEEGK